MQYLLNAEQMKSADSHTIQDLGVSSRTLMERAAAACTDYICRTDDKPNRTVYISDGSVQTVWRNAAYRMAG